MPMLWYAYIQVLKSCWCIIFRRVDADFRLLPVPYRTLRFHANCFDARRRFQSSKPSTFFLGPVGTGYMVSTGSLTEYWVQVGHEIGVKEACGRHHTSTKCSRIPQPSQSQMALTRIAVWDWGRIFVAESSSDAGECI
jgi:hypothetical protein